MSSARSEAVQKRLQALFESGSMAGVPDSQLLERFVIRRDSEGETAFAILVARHGPMVLGVCRYLLRDVHSADDAFQAVFLVLARRAGSIRQPDLLGPWLHGVATRIARKARAQTSRRIRREQCEVEMNDIESVGPEANPRSIDDEDATALHEEIGRLPERYRRAVVLCHFEGLTHGEAARRLGCAPGTVGSLVSRARELLRTRLARRGLSASSLALGAALEPRIATAAVSSALERATVRAALSFATNRAVVAGIVSRPAAELAYGALKTMTLHKAVIACAFVMALGFAAAVGGFAAGLSGEPPWATPERARMRQANRKGYRRRNCRVPSRNRRPGSNKWRPSTSRRSSNHRPPTRTRRHAISKRSSSSDPKWKSAFQRARIAKAGRRQSSSDWAASRLFFRR